ncbi:MAG: DUF1778 domain-containing protein [Bryobacteraceae bacterium]|jgi:uncharacterized protein (DUF4415 family)
MAIAENPKRKDTKEEKAEQFIASAGKPKEADKPLRPIMLRVDPDLLEMIDRAAKRSGLTRTGFIVSNAIKAAKEIERMES